MTPYEQGFMQKCAERGLDHDASCALKQAAGANEMLRNGQLTGEQIHTLRQRGMLRSPEQYAKGLDTGSDAIMAKRYPNLAYADLSSKAPVAPAARSFSDVLKNIHTNYKPGVTYPVMAIPDAGGHTIGVMNNNPIASIAGRTVYTPSQNKATSALLRRHELNELIAADKNIIGKPYAAGYTGGFASHLSPDVLQKEYRDIQGLDPRLKSDMSLLRKRTLSKPFNNLQPIPHEVRQRLTEAGFKSNHAFGGPEYANSVWNEGHFGDGAAATASSWGRQNAQARPLVNKWLQAEGWNPKTGRSGMPVPIADAASRFDSMVVQPYNKLLESRPVSEWSTMKKPIGTAPAVRPPLPAPPSTPRPLDRARLLDRLKTYRESQPVPKSAPDVVSQVTPRPDMTQFPNYRPSTPPAAPTGMLERGVQTAGKVVKPVMNFANRVGTMGMKNTAIGGPAMMAATEGAGPASAALGAASGAPKGQKMQAAGQAWNDASSDTMVGQVAGAVADKSRLQSAAPVPTQPNIASNRASSGMLH